MYNISQYGECVVSVVDETDFSWINFFKSAGIPDDDAVQ